MSLDISEMVYVIRTKEKFQSNPIDYKEFSDVNMFTSEKSLQSFGLD